MDTSSLLQLILYIGLTLLVFAGFYLLVWRFQPDYLRASVQPLRDLAAWWRQRKGSPPSAGPVKRDVWTSYLEAISAIAAIEAVKQMLDGKGDMTPDQLKLLRKTFNLGAARRTAEGIVVDFFSSLTEEDVTRLAEAIARNHRGKNRPEIADIAAFLKREQVSIAANRHLALSHVERIEKYLGGGECAMA